MTDINIDDLIKDLHISSPSQNSDIYSWPGGPYYPDDNLQISMNTIHNKRTTQNFIIPPVVSQFASQYSNHILRDDEVFKNNFWFDFKNLLPLEGDFRSIDDVLWSFFKYDVDDNIDNTQQILQKHGFIISNGKRILLDTYSVRPAGIMGEAQDWYRGKLFFPLTTHNVVLNNNPDLNTTTWLASWKNSITLEEEYIIYNPPYIHSPKIIPEEILTVDELIERSSSSSGDMSNIDMYGEKVATHDDDQEYNPDSDDNISYGESEVEWNDDEEISHLMGAKGETPQYDKHSYTKLNEVDDSPLNFNLLTKREQFLPLFYIRSIEEQYKILKRAYETNFSLVKDMDKVMDNVLAKFIKDNNLQQPNKFIQYAQTRGIDL